MPEPSPTSRLTPGAYLKHRRQAAGLAVADVARSVETEPRIAEHLRGELIEMIEADVQPLSFTTAVALRFAFPFDLDVLFSIELARLAGVTGAGPQVCRICACSENDACRIVSSGAIGSDPVLCHWIDPDLCSNCAAPRQAVA